MTTSSSAGYPRDAVFAWFAHRIGWLWALALMLDVASRMYPTLPLLLGECTADLLVVAGVIAEMCHPRLCTRCADRVPLDPQRMVFRRLRLLRTYHQMRSPWLGTAWLTVAILASAPGLIWPGWSGGFEVICAWAAVSWVLAEVHQPLRPWCPFCRRWDDGGDPERVPTPPPAEVGTHT